MILLAVLATESVLAIAIIVVLTITTIVVFAGMSAPMVHILVQIPGSAWTATLLAPIALILAIAPVLLVRVASICTTLLVRIHAPME